MVFVLFDSKQVMFEIIFLIKALESERYFSEFVVLQYSECVWSTTLKWIF